jgi:hypothetical protein
MVEAERIAVEQRGAEGGWMMAFELITIRGLANAVR